MLLDQDSRNRLMNMLGSCVAFDEPMSRHTYFRVGGPAEAFTVPESLEQLTEIIIWSGNKGIPYIVIGDGSNLLVKDNGIPGIVILITKCLSGISCSGKDTEPVLVTAMAGVKAQALCRYAIREGLSGMNFALGIPGTVGGAIMMNAGTSYGAVSDILVSVNVMISSGEMLKIAKDEMVFSYRNLSWNKSLTDRGKGAPIIIDGSFRLRRSDPSLLEKEAGEIMKKRRENQPSDKPSAGCFFKNPPAGKTAGQLIDMAGLKGTRIGGAEISAKHANFIVNSGKASASDILALMRLVQQKVSDRFGIILEPEVKIVGI
ncbi:MAG: UDP-N-acetylenolpyruvoylglucosamine reductase [Thermodesulfobacteriota bacterium]|nr:UDP-N-acetylenolpyruvoylglucosamine reductase [Thermodesulfobacteriota bacterium]